MKRGQCVKVDLTHSEQGPLRRITMRQSRYMRKIRKKILKENT